MHAHDSLDDLDSLLARLDVHDLQPEAAAGLSEKCLKALSRRGHLRSPRRVFWERAAGGLEPVVATIGSAGYLVAAVQLVLSLWLTPKS